MIKYTFNNWMDEEIHPTFVFNENFGRNPNYIHCDYLNLKRELDYKKDFIDSESVISIFDKIPQAKKYIATSTTSEDEGALRLNKFVVISPTEEFLILITAYAYNRSYTINFTCLAIDENSLSAGGIIVEALKENYKELIKPKSNKARINYVSMDADGFNLIEIGSAESDDDESMILDHYNDDFLHVSDHIIERLTNTLKGIVLLHGEPGTGKTSYIRYLIRQLDRRIIYLPPDLTRELSNPSFFTFLMNYPESIIIIEDGETVIASREAGHNPTVANLLNVTDGILGDALKIQVICTFNAEIDDVDSALLRPGRLIAKHHFDKLETHKTKALVHKLHGTDVEPKESRMTLAEIFNMADEHIIPKKIERVFGFNQ